MATPRDIRYMAFQTLFQLDARGEGDREAIRQFLIDSTAPIRDRENSPETIAPAPARRQAGRPPLSPEELTDIGWRVDFTEFLRGPIREIDVDKALTMAMGAWKGRTTADDALRELAPTWPAYRQPAVDRAIIRLAHFEMTKAGINPKIAVNEAIEIAKQFSTDRSPGFINGVLDKIMKQVLAAADQPAEDTAPESPEPETA